MQTRVVQGEAGVKEAAEWIRAGWPVAFPTETVYGLGADAFSAEAASRIFLAKGRPADNPLIVHVLDVDAVLAVAEPPLPPLAKPLADRFWPGPLTLVLPARDAVPAVVRAGLATVAVRCPSHPVARALIAAAGPLAAPSANRAGRPSPTRAEDVLEDLGGRIPLILDGGPTWNGVESTVIDISQDPPLLLRPGALPRAAIEAVTGPLGEPDAGSLRRSPGTRHRHYAPVAPVTWLEEDDPEKVWAWWREHAAADWALLAPAPVVARVGVPWAASLGEGPVEAAQRLFAGLRDLDRFHPARIVVAWRSQEGVGEAVRNRLAKAATPESPEATEAPFLLFVCTGNTCRSPLAAALWNRLNTGIPAESAGVGAVLGAPAAPEAVAAAKRHGAELETHRSRPLQAVVGTPLWVVVMTRDQARAVVRQRPEWAGRIRLLRELAGEEGEVEDPLGRGQAAYDILASQLERWLVAIRHAVAPEDA
ncbi:MAG: threonylcarbamoyl-AMP synthase [Firmicutes bacterium]|nr:threonylcarbamoyl-AMP synthase [Alicyclobacillaceae bacterium]MCL6497690.1 threonylcarbamoyl-AMP synthase [Bacillota bacterium]